MALDWQITDDLSNLPNFLPYSTVYYSNTVRYANGHIHLNMIIDASAIKLLRNVTGFRKTDPNRTFGILRITNLKI